MTKLLKNKNGSVSLEAAIVVPIFIFLLLFFYGFIMMFAGQELITHSMFQCGQSLSLDSYATETFDTTNFQDAKGLVTGMYNTFTTNDPYFSSSDKWYEEDDISEEVEKRFLGFFASGEEDNANSFLKLVGVVGGIENLNFSESYIDDNNDIHIIVKYEQEFLFNINGLVNFPREIEVVSHMWGR